MNRKLILAGAVFGLIAILLGAFGAHGLKPLLSAESIAIFETGIRYQMYSAFFLLALSVMPLDSEKVKKICFYLTIMGVLLFSGSIYLLATNTLSSFDFRVIGFLTPMGGALLIAAWSVLLFRGIKLKKK